MHKIPVKIGNYSIIQKLYASNIGYKMHNMQRMTYKNKQTAHSRIDEAGRVWYDTNNHDAKQLRAHIVDSDGIT